MNADAVAVTTSAMIAIRPQQYRTFSLENIPELISTNAKFSTGKGVEHV